MNEQIADGYYWMRTPYVRRDTGEQQPGTWDIVRVYTDRKKERYVRGISWSARAPLSHFTSEMSLAYSVFQPIAPPKEEPVPAVERDYRVRYDIRSGTTGEVVITGHYRVRATSQNEAEQKTVAWVDKNDPYCDSRIDPSIEISDIQEVDDEPEEEAETNDT